MIAKFVLGDKILPKIMDHIAKVYKLDKVLNYMELPNDADNRIDKLEEQVKMLAKKIDE
jgi:presenilin-like A22 family membrane protease|tara:strand:+ start:51 stop:227 length:177 start_codon:yes stop_codon:yes gene_type:complete